MNSLAIYGAGGHGKVIADAAELCGWKKILFFDENHVNQTHNGPWPVVGDFEELSKRLPEFKGVIIAIGNNLIRLEKHNQLLKLGANIVSIIHPSATISPYANIGLGSVVVAGAVINPFSKVGDAAIINTSASVGHDCELGNAVHICPGTRLAGHVSIGESSWIGVGSSVVQEVSITNNVYIGAGSVVVKDIEESGTYFGVPAKLIKS